MELILTQLRLDQIVTETPFLEAPPSLLENMRRYGQLDPVHARPLDADRYELSFGEPILAAARALRREGLAAICETAACAALPRSLRALILDKQRQSLKLLHRARFTRDLVENEGFSQAAIAKLLDVSRALPSLMLRVLRFPDLEGMVDREALPFSAAIELSALEEEAPRRAYLEELREEKRRRKRFPSVAEIRRGVDERLGKPGLPVLTEELLLPFVADLLAQDRPIAVEVATGRRPITTVCITVPKAEREATTALIDRLRRGKEEPMP
jgi:ParB-like chromosome segregation protein Spo0J